MDLSDLSKLADAQDKGHTFELRDPVHGEPTGLKITVAGPDSARVKKAQAEMAREVAKHDRRGNGIPPQESMRLYNDFLFAVTISWDIKEGGKVVPFNRANFQRLVDAGTWVRAQIDQFVSDRSPYFAAAS